MPALTFMNNTGQSKFEDTFNFNGFVYHYTIYLMPLTNQTEIIEIISYFGTRKYKGKLCLDTKIKNIAKMIKDNDVSAFLIVKVDGIENIASGSLQYYPWCKIGRRSIKDIWINDVCKIASDDVIQQEKKNPDSTGKPVDAMFHLMEQLVVQNLGIRNIKLYVENDPSSNRIFLLDRYGTMGFSEYYNCGGNNFPDQTVMEKPITPDTGVIDFSFLTTITGGKYKKRRYTKRKFLKNKTYKRKSRK